MPSAWELLCDRSAIAGCLIGYEEPWPDSFLTEVFQLVWGESGFFHETTLLKTPVFTKLKCFTALPFRVGACRVACVPVVSLGSTTCHFPESLRDENCASSDCCNPKDLAVQNKPNPLPLPACPAEGRKVSNLRDKSLQHKIAKQLWKNIPGIHVSRFQRHIDIEIIL